MQVLLVMERRAIKKTEEFGSPYLSQARGDGRGSDKNDIRSKLSCPQDLQSLMRSTCLFFLHNMTKKYKNCNIIGIILFLFIYSICYLWFHIQDRDHSLCMDLSDGLQSGAIHGVLVAAILQVIIITDVLHHLVMWHKIVVLSILLILLGGSCCVWQSEERFIIFECFNWSFLSSLWVCYCECMCSSYGGWGMRTDLDVWWWACSWCASCQRREHLNEK